MVNLGCGKWTEGPRRWIFEVAKQMVAFFSDSAEISGVCDWSFFFSSLLVKVIGKN